MGFPPHIGRNVFQSDTLRCNDGLGWFATRPQMSKAIEEGLAIRIEGDADGIGDDDVNDNVCDGDGRLHLRWQPGHCPQVER